MRGLNRRGMLRLVVCGSISLSLLCLARQAEGARAEADARGATATGAGTSSDLRAYSDDGADPLVNKNVSPSQFNIPNPQPTVNNGSSVTVGAGIIAAGRVYTPGHGRAGIPKPVPNPDIQWVKSQSGMSVGKAQVSSWPTLMALAIGKAGGTGASSAEDPGFLSPGSYPFAPMVGYMALEIDGPGEYAAAETIADDDSSATPIYTLVIAAENTLNSPSDLDILFTYDPTRLTLDSGQTPSSIAASVRSRFTVSSGVASFGSSSLSQEGIDPNASPPPWPPIVPLFTGTYLVGGSGVNYEDGVIAAAESVIPEPAAISLLALGVLVVRRRGRQS